MNKMMLNYQVLFICLLWNPLFSQIGKTDRPAKVDSAPVFRFAILADRTGGMRGGVFKKAIDKLNILRPDFVMSVGDLIDGYTSNEGYLRKQWNEFEDIIDRLEMKFYRLAGNHDISNEWMTGEWKKRFGQTFYHFVHKNVLFLCLNTEDPPPGGISQDQVEYVTGVLDKNGDVTWTLVFMHRPFWNYGDQAGYEKIETLLRERPYTVFSGHHHNYLKAFRNGRTHYVLGTTGGGSNLSGPDLGELDHIMWVTMTRDGPVVANLTLDGVLRDDLVTKETVPLVEILRSGDWLKVNPVVHPETEFKKLRVTVELVNKTDTEMTVTGRLAVQHGLSFSPDSIYRRIKSGVTETLTVMVNSQNAVPITDFETDPIVFDLTASFDVNDDKSLSLNARQILLMDNYHICPRVVNKHLPDGQLIEWNSEYFIEVKRPQYIKEDWDWRGVEDGWFKFAVTRSEKNLHIAVQTLDDCLIVSNKKLSDLQDKLFIHLLPMEGEPYMLEFSPYHHVRHPGIISKCLMNSDGMIVEVLIPLIHIGHWQDGFRLNVGWMDHDRPNNTKPSVLWWRPLWESETDYQKSGTFILKGVPNV